MPDELDPAQLLLHFNGINARTGESLLAPVPIEVFATSLVPPTREDNEIAPDGGVGTPDDDEDVVEREDPRDESEAAAKRRFRQAEDGLMKVVAGVDDSDIAQAGWGVVFSGLDDHAALVDEIKAQLEPLIALRQRQAGDLFVCYDGKKGVRDETGGRWMARHGVGAGSADPRQMPFYLLVVGPPEHVSFEFQYRLDLQRAVGRLHFDDPADYRRYADAVVATETAHAGGPTVDRHLALFGPRSRGDVASSLSMSRLIQPLGEDLGRFVGWRAETTVDAAATRDRLADLINAQAPALLVTAGHGIGYDAGDPEQRPRQGALVCADWPGIRTPVAPEHTFAAADVAADAPLAGRMAFFFACYGGGTPAQDDYAHRADPTSPRQISPEPFVAALPQRLLAGGMLAVMAHVDRAWSDSFMDARAGAQVQTFASTLRALMQGKPVGVAFDDFNVRTGELAFDLADLHGRVAAREIESYVPYAAVWTAATDARNYVVLGDPATRLNT